MQTIKENNKDRPKTLIVGQGGSGCVFIYQNQPKKVYKIFVEKSRFNKEVQSTQFVQQHVDKKFKYTPIYYKSYTKKVDTKQFIQLLKNCNFAPQQQIYILELENCGDSIHYLQIRSRQEFVFFLQSFINILEALKIFSIQKVIHNDIKPANIVYDSQKKISKIIDFSLLVQLPNKKTNLGTPKFPISQQLIGFFQRIPNWHLSFHPIEYMIISNPIFATNVSPIYIYNMYIQQIHNGEFPDKIGDFLEQHILNKKQFIKQYQEIKNSIFKYGLYDFYDKIDIYGAGYTLLFMLIKYKNFVSKNQFNLILHFCQQIMDINYKKRLNPQQAILHYQNLLQQLNFHQNQKNNYKAQTIGPKVHGP